MAEYVVVENGEIVESHGALPRAWRHVSGLNLLQNDIPALLSLGWYPVQKVSVAYNPETQRLTGYTYQIFDQYVEETPIIEAIPQNELPSFEYKKQQFMNQLRSMRNEKLRETDWTQVLDCALSAEEVQNYRVYRQALRDLPNSYENNSVVDIGNVIWPSV